MTMGFTENSVCQSSSKWVPFSNQGRIRQGRWMGSAFHQLGTDKAGKGEGWALPFISHAQDTVCLLPALP